MALIVLESVAMEAPIAVRAAEAIGPARLLQCTLRLLNSTAGKLELMQTPGDYAHAL